MVEVTASTEAVQRSSICGIYEKLGLTMVRRTIPLEASQGSSTCGICEIRVSQRSRLLFQWREIYAAAHASIFEIEMQVREHNDNDNE